MTYGKFLMYVNLLLKTVMSCSRYSPGFYACETCALSLSYTTDPPNVTFNGFLLTKYHSPYAWYPKPSTHSLDLLIQPSLTSSLHTVI